MPRRTVKKKGERDELIQHLLTTTNGEDPNSFEAHELKTTLNYRKKAGENDIVDGKPMRQVSKEQDQAFIIHILEPHHTLAGISLQYGVRVEPIMRANKLFTLNDLHSRSEIKIPVNKHGSLYHDPEAFKSDDPDGTATHTTVKARHATEEDMSPSQTDDRVTPSPPPLDSAAFLDDFDDQMQTAIRAMDRALKEQLSSNEDENGNSPMMFGFDSHERNPSEMSLYPTDWRWLLCITVTIFASAPLIYYLWMKVEAPEPHDS